jgi:hypothetical protein
MGLTSEQRYHLKQVLLEEAGKPLSVSGILAAVDSERFICAWDVCVKENLKGQRQASKDAQRLREQAEALEKMVGK